MCEALYDQINKGEAMAVAPPEPAGTDAAAFVAALHRLKVWSGLGYRHLERRAGDHVDPREGHLLLGAREVEGVPVA